MIEVYAPMLVGKAPKNYKDKFANEKIIGTVKKDGYWSQLVKDNNEIHLYSRSISKKTGYYSDNIDKVPHIKNWAMDNLPNGTTLIGEIYYPDGTSKNVTSILGAVPQKAIERQDGEYGKLHFYLHDILAYDGCDYVMNEVDYSHRYSNLCLNIDIRTPLIDEIEIATCCDNTYCDLEKCAERAIADGEEGMVFRTESGLYAPGKRQPQTMFKIKRGVDDVDLIILDILDPEYLYTGKVGDAWPYKDEDGNLITKAAYHHWAGGFSLGALDGSGSYIKVCNVTSGLTDDIKKRAAESPDDFIGQVVQVNCMSFDSIRKTLRHPYFVKMRPDKPAQDCKVQDIFI